MRPLRALEYDNETNYFLGSFTGKNPTLQLLELEAVIADWRAAELQLNFNNGIFVAAVPGCQRTLGVGPRGNWVHACQIQVPVYVRSDIVGGRAAYFFAWQPDEESPWAAYLIAGAERVAVTTSGGTVGPGAGHRGGRISTDAVPTNLGPGGGPEIPVYLPLAAFDLFYTINERLSIGIENDVFAHPSHGQYVVLPQFEWQPLVHLSFKGGINYIQQGGEGQAMFKLRVMVTQPHPSEDNLDDHDPNLAAKRRSREGFGRFLRRGGLSSRANRIRSVRGPLQACTSPASPSQPAGSTWTVAWAIGDTENGRGNADRLDSNWQPGLASAGDRCSNQGVKHGHQASQAVSKRPQRPAVGYHRTIVTSACGSRGSSENQPAGGSQRHLLCPEHGLCVVRSAA